MQGIHTRRTAVAALVFHTACSPPVSSGGAAGIDDPDSFFTPDPPVAEWRHHGGGLDGTRYAHDAWITPENVGTLEPAWEYRTGDATGDPDRYFGRNSTFKATPILFHDRLVFSTGFNRVVALDPGTGEELWTHDPGVDFSVEYSEMFTSRGVAAWSDPMAPEGAPCAHSIYLGTLDARLIALDAETGGPCADFGSNGEVDLSEGIRNFRRGEYSVTSPPLVVNGVVVVGSSIGDNGAVTLDEGAVRAFDARTGELRWRFDPIPRAEGDSGWEGWDGRQARRTGGGNVWSIMAADAERDLIFLPTTSPSPDFYGGERRGENRHANSIVALRARSGEMVWSYQVVRHDLWDYDLASQPLLLDLDMNGARRPVLALATKMGFVFVLDRETGEPIHDVEERSVPGSPVRGEDAAPTQRFPRIQLHPTDPLDLQRWSVDEDHEARCDAMLDGIRYEGIFTPPSLDGSLLYPGNAGGVNWGSMAADPASGVALVAVNRLPTVVKLIPRDDFERLDAIGTVNGVEAQYTEQSGTPYGMARFDVLDPETGLPCFAGPWSTLVALDLVSGDVLWEMPAGAGVQGDAPGVPSAEWGSWVRGGPILTSGGVGFLATPLDFSLRAIDMATGEVLWRGGLPAAPGATPMAYRHEGRSFVVTTAGGDLAEGEGRGDWVIAWTPGTG